MSFTIKQQGFSLIEITVVLAIVGLLLAATITPLSVSIEQGQRAQVEEQFEDIEDALMGYTLSNGQLPCPDCRTGSSSTNPNCTSGVNSEGDGLEDRDAAGDCALDAATGIGNVIIGNLPWATLGVNGIDSWGRTFNYAVDEDFADTPVPPTGTCPDAQNVSFALCSNANINIKQQALSCIGSTDINIATGIPAVVYSQGSNLATSCNELENTNNDNIFISAQYNQSPATFYDDLIFWISPFVLNSRLVKAELLP